MTVVSIVILNWRSYPIVLDAIQSALAQQDVEIDLIVVDNGTTDGSVEDIRRSFRDVRLIEVGYNAGFAAGMNLGAAAARGEFLLLQNADLILEDNYCRFAVDAMRRDPHLGVVGGLVNRLSNGTKTDVLDASGYTISPLFRARLLDPTRPGLVLGVSGSCPFLRMSAVRVLIDRVGYMLDPWYFTYFEDIDLMIRINLAGWRVAYVPEMRAWHTRSGSTAIASRFFDKPLFTLRHHLKNRIATIIKTLPRAFLARWLAPLLITELLLPFFLLAKRPAGLRAWGSAWAALLGEFPRLLSDRRQIVGQAPPAVVDYVGSRLKARSPERGPEERLNR